MSTQVVYRLQGEAAPFTLVQKEEPVPVIDKHEVLIKIRAVALNYRDIAILTGKYPLAIKLDLVPGSDAAGEVVKVGSTVSDVAVGDHVIGLFDLKNIYGPLKEWKWGHGGNIDGMLRQYIALPEEAVVKIPKEAKLSFSQMASLVCTGTTAWNALYGNTLLRPGQTVLLQGTGGVAITGLILAKAAGATTIITSSSDEKLALVQKKFGADYTINYKTTPDWAAEANKITQGRGVDFVLDNGGAGTIKQSVEAITMGGIIAVIGFLAPVKQEDMPDITGLAMGKGCVIRGINVGSRQLLEELVRFVVAKELAPPVEKTFGFSKTDVEAAYDFIESGSHIGKVCIEVD